MCAVWCSSNNIPAYSSPPELRTVERSHWRHSVATMPIAAQGSSWQGDDPMDRFLQEQNIALYRRLRKSSTGRNERLAIFKLLTEEMDKLKKSFGKPSSASRPLSSTAQSTFGKSGHRAP